MPSHSSENFFDTIVYLGKLCGVCLETKSSNRLWKTFHLVYDITILSIASYFFISEALILTATTKNRQKILSQIGWLGAAVLSGLKFLCMMEYREKLAIVMDRIQSKDFKYERYGNFNANARIAIERKFCRHFVIGIYVWYSMVAYSAYISALWKLSIEQKGEYFEKSATCYDYIPHYFFIPFDTERTASCRYAFVIMNCGISIFSLYLATHDALLFSLLICLRAQMEIVCEATRNIRGRIISKMNLPEWFNPLHDEDFPEFENELFAEITKCNLHLSLLFRVHGDIENMFTLTTLLQMAGSLYMIASALFGIFVINYHDPAIYHLVQYMLVILSQLFFTCYFGSCVTEASLFYKRCLYECDWYSASKRFKVSILIMLCRLEKPLYLTAGKFFPLTLGTVVSVLRGSFSYAAMYRAIG